jgi:hypothetical protein
MNESQARAALLLRAADEAAAAGAPSAAWSRDDAAWATRQAAAEVGPAGTPAAFVGARCRVAMDRLGERDAAAVAWVDTPLTSTAWVLAALALGLVLGLALDQLGAPQRVNLLAPAVWAVVAWNLIVCGIVLWRAVRPAPAAAVLAAPWLRRLAGAGQRWLGDDPSRLLREAHAAWLQAAAPLLAARAALVLHVAAAAVAAGLIAGLYLRGLVLDYRAGWQSTFLDAPRVQALLDAALAPAAAVTGVAVPEVAPLRLGPEGAAHSSAAPWIHLYAATLALAVLLPRALLGGLALRRARTWETRFPLPLETAYFESLHPLMRPQQARCVRLLLGADPAPGSRLFDQALGPGPGACGPWVLLESGQGDRLELVGPAWRPGPAEPGAGSTAAAPGGPRRALRWLRRLGRRAADADPLRAWRLAIDAVVLAPDATLPPPLAVLERPVLRLGASAGERDDGWLREGRVLAALHDTLPGDRRIVRLAAAWHERETRRLHGLADVAAARLAVLASRHEPLGPGTGLLGRRAEAEAARERLLAALAAQQQQLDADAAAAAGEPQVLDAAGVPLDAAGDSARPAAVRAGLPAAGAALHRRVGEGRAALLGGALGGALVGLKADLASGGLTMGTGALAGGVLGALGAAGAARGINLVRGVERDHVAWDERALAGIAAAFSERVLVAGWRPQGLSEAERAAHAAAWATEGARLQTLWRSRPAVGAADAGPGHAALAGAGAGHAALAGALAPLLREVFVHTLGGPAPDGGPPRDPGA